MHLPLYQLGIFELAQVMVQQMACLLVDYKSSTSLIQDPEVVLIGLPFLDLLVHYLHFLSEQLGHELGYDHKEHLPLMVKNSNYVHIEKYGCNMRSKN